MRLLRGNDRNIFAPAKIGVSLEKISGRARPWVATHTRTLSSIHRQWSTRARPWITWLPRSRSKAAPAHRPRRACGQSAYRRAPRYPPAPHEACLRPDALRLPRFKEQAPTHHPTASARPEADLTPAGAIGTCEARQGRSGRMSGPCDGSCSERCTRIRLIVDGVEFPLCAKRSPQGYELGNRP